MKRETGIAVTEEIATRLPLKISDQRIAYYY